jgi:hypothetical protein
MILPSANEMSNIMSNSQKETNDFIYWLIDRVYTAR